MTIAVVTCVRDEEDIIEEWVAHHLGVGFDRVQIFDNCSSDRTSDRIARINRVYPHVTVDRWASSEEETQKSAFAEGLAKMRAEGAEWCAFIDADEFIAPSNPDRDQSLRQFLAGHADNAAIGLNWAIYGSAGHIVCPRGLVQEAFLYRSDSNFDVNRHIKSIVRPEATRGIFHTHGMMVDKPYVNVHGDQIRWRTDAYGTPVHPFAYTDNDPVMDGWRVNHYFCRWRHRWDDKVRLSERIGAVWRREADWDHHDRNEVYDPVALEWIGRDRQIMESFDAESLAAM